MRISGTDQWSLAKQSTGSLKYEMWCQKGAKQGKAKRDGVFNPQYYTLCPKSPSARGLVSSLPVRLLFKSI